MVQETENGRWAVRAVADRDYDYDCAVPNRGAVVVHAAAVHAAAAAAALGPGDGAPLPCAVCPLSLPAHSQSLL